MPRSNSECTWLIRSQPSPDGRLGLVYEVRPSATAALLYSMTPASLGQAYNTRLVCAGGGASLEQR